MSRATWVATTSPPAVSRGRRVGKWLLGSDRPRDLLFVAGTFVTYLLVDLATRALSDVPDERLARPVLVVESARAHWLLYAVALAGVIGFGVVFRARIWSLWSVMENGRTLRRLAVVFLFVLAWQGSLYEYNFLLGQTHLLDRLLLVALAVGSVFRPVLLAPTALQSRVIARQFAYPFDTTAGQNIDELMVICVLVLAAVHLMYVATGRTGTEAVVLLLGAAVATHFFIPGRSKLAMGWLAENDISNLPLSGHTAGWLGETDGAWARTLASLVAPLNRPLLIGTLVLELGSALAATHYKLMRVWLFGAVAFHAALFAAIGFWFLVWIVIEGALLVVFFAPRLQGWLGRNLTPARAILTFLAIVGGGAFLFHPPRLAWFDAPISYGYRIEATGINGTRYQVPASAFAPLTQEIVFMMMSPGGVRPASGGYGAVGLEGLARLRQVSDFEDLEALERPADPQEVRHSEELLASWLDYANHHGQSFWELLAPPDHFWTGSGERSYRFDEELQRIEVSLVTSIHDAPGRLHSRGMTTIDRSDGQ